MRVRICADERTAIDEMGVRHEINGLVIKKKDAKGNTINSFYGTDTSLFKNVCHRGHTSTAEKAEDGKINLN